MNKRHIIVSGHKFPGCQKYWLIKRKELYGVDADTDIFDISMGYSTFYFKGKTLQEAEDYLLDFIKEKAERKIRVAEKLVAGLRGFLEDKRVLTTEQLLEKYKIMD